MSKHYCQDCDEEVAQLSINNLCHTCEKLKTQEENLVAEVIVFSEIPEVKETISLNSKPTNIIKLNNNEN
jgi:hypothetical protein